MVVTDWKQLLMILIHHAESEHDALGRCTATSSFLQLSLSLTVLQTETIRTYPKSLGKTWHWGASQCCRKDHDAGEGIFTACIQLGLVRDGTIFSNSVGRIPFGIWVVEALLSNWDDLDGSVLGSERVRIKTRVLQFWNRLELERENLSLMYVYLDFCARLQLLITSFRRGSLGTFISALITFFLPTAPEDWDAASWCNKPVTDAETAVDCCIQQMALSNVGIQIGFQIL